MHHLAETSYYTEQLISGFKSKENPLMVTDSQRLEKVKGELGKYTQVNHDRLGHDIAYADDCDSPLDGGSNSSD